MRHLVVPSSCARGLIFAVCANQPFCHFRTKTDTCSLIRWIPRASASAQVRRKCMLLARTIRSCKFVEEQCVVDLFSSTDFLTIFACPDSRPHSARAAFPASTKHVQRG